MIRAITSEPLDRHIEIKQQRTLAVVPHHALNPEERCESGASGHWADVMEAAGRIENQMTRGKFDGVNAVGVFDHQLAAFVFIWIAEKERGGKIGAHTMG